MSADTCGAVRAVAGEGGRGARAARGMLVTPRSRRAAGGTHRPCRPARALRAAQWCRLAAPCRAARRRGRAARCIYAARSAEVKLRSVNRRRPLAVATAADAATAFQAWRHDFLLPPLLAAARRTWRRRVSDSVQPKRRPQMILIVTVARF